MEITRDFQTLQQWIDYSQTDHPNDAHFPCSSKATNGSAFSGVSTKEEAYRLFRAGWPEGLKRMRAIMEGVTANIQMPTVRDVFLPSVEGCAPNIEAFIQGIPEDMFVISQIDETAPPSQLTVQFELAYSAGISAEEAMLAGAVVFAAMEMLRVQGCNVSALLSWTTQTRGKWQCTVPIPSSTDMDTLSFLFSHPAVLRRIMFAIMEHEPYDVRANFNFGMGYGQPAEKRHPEANAMVTMHKLCMECHQNSYGSNSIDGARRLLQKLVDTRFGTLPPPSAPSQ